MKESRKASKWLRSAYVVYGIVFTGIIGGLIQVLTIADYINYGIVKALEVNAAGVDLYGKFLFPKSWFVFSIIVASLLFIFPAVSVLRYFVDKSENTESKKNLLDQIINLKRDRDHIIRNADSIINYGEFARFDTKKVEIKYDVSDQGDTLVDALITIESTAKPAQFYRFWIDADTESEAVHSFRELRFEVTEFATGRKLDSILVRDDPKNKMFAIFVPNHTSSTQTKLRICYRWPGFMRKLLELKVAHFSWRYLSNASDACVPFKLEWNFSNKIDKVNCRIVRPHSDTASVYSENRVSSTAWIYVDPAAPITKSHSVEFTSAD